MADKILDWEQLGQTNIDEVERPRIIPIGTYSANFAGKAEQVKANSGSLGYKFPVRLVEPMNDVDGEEFQASSGFVKGGYEMTFWLTPSSLYRFTEFGKGMGASGMSIPDLAEYLGNSEDLFVVSVEHTESKKQAGQFYVNLNNPIPMSVYAA